MKRPPAKDLIAALSEARTDIEACRHTHICIALGEAARRNNKRTAASDYLREYITRQLRGHMTLDHWSWANRPELGVSYSKARLQWIDWMIESIKETG